MIEKCYCETCNRLVDESLEEHFNWHMNHPIFIDSLKKTFQEGLKTDTNVSLFK